MFDASSAITSRHIPSQGRSSCPELPPSGPIGERPRNRDSAEDDPLSSGPRCATVDLGGGYEAGGDAPAVPPPGGSAAEGVGRRLKKLAVNNQVLCVTHLPQIASFADHHYLVEKRESKGRTEATVEELDGAARTREVGRMLSGQKLTPEALKHAEQLIKMSV